jgi:hypothetical protein
VESQQSFVNAGEVNLADMTIGGQEFLHEAIKKECFKLTAIILY